MGVSRSEKQLFFRLRATIPSRQGNRGQNSLVSLLQWIVLRVGIFTRSQKLSIDIAFWFLSAVEPASFHSNTLRKTMLLPSLAPVITSVSRKQLLRTSHTSFSTLYSGTVRNTFWQDWNPNTKCSYNQTNFTYFHKIIGRSRAFNNLRTSLHSKENYRYMFNKETHLLQSHNPSSRTIELGPKNSFPGFSCGPNICNNLVIGVWKGDGFSDMGFATFICVSQYCPTKA
jgi:hypothetical protein